MSEGAVKGKKSYVEEAVAKYQGKTRKREEEKTEAKETPVEERFADIEANPFHKIVIQTDVDPEEKQKLVAEALAFEEELSKEDNEAKLASFEEFKEYLMAYRKEMSKEIIRLSDTETFAELQRVFEDMNASLLDFENQIKPLMEIIDAVNKLNMASDGQVYEVYKEIEEDRAEEERIAKIREENEAKITGYEQDIRAINGDIASMRQEKKFIFFGGPSNKTLGEIARKESEINDIQADVVDIREETENLSVDRETRFAEFAQEKDKLRELLDLTSDEHTERQEALVQAALNFVNTTEDRSGAVLGHMRDIKDQIGNIDDVNSQMQNIFAVVNEGVKDAEDMNATLTDKFSTVAEDESQVARVKREDKLKSINEHVEVTTASKVDTLATLGELQEESLNIRSMRETNRQQIDQTRRMHSSGTAGVASRLSTVLTAVSSAALNESKTAVQNTLKGMNRITTEIAGQEAIKNATNLHVQNDEFAQAIEKLAEFKNIADGAAEITRSAIEDSKKLQGDMESTARELEESIKKLKGTTADVMQNDEPGSEGRRAASEQDNKKSEPKSESGLKQFKL